MDINTYIKNKIIMIQSHIFFLNMIHQDTLTFFIYVVCVVKSYMLKFIYDLCIYREKLYMRGCVGFVNT